MIKTLKSRGAALVALASAAMLSAGTSIAAVSPLVTQATTDAADAKTDVLAVAGLLMGLAVVLWGAFKLIGLFGRR